MLFLLLDPGQEACYEHQNQKTSNLRVTDCSITKSGR